MINLLRRSFLFGAGALAAAPFVRSAAAQSTPMEAIDFGAMLKYPFVVPPLPYGYDANEPAIDTLTMQLAICFSFANRVFAAGPEECGFCPVISRPSVTT